MLLTFLGKYREGAMLFLRIGLGVMFLIHGLPLLMQPARWHELGGAMSVVGMTAYLGFWGFMAAVSETVGAILFIIGIFFRPACFFLAFTMTIATLMHYKHHDDFNSKTSHAAEMAIVFWSLMFIGPGKYSVDKN